MTSSPHCNLAAPKGFNTILQAQLCCCKLSGGLSGTEHSFTVSRVSPGSKYSLEDLYLLS